MDKILKRVYNRSPKDQYILVKGKKFGIGAFEEKVCEDTLADAFLDQLPGVVVPAEMEFGEVAQIDEAPKTVWVANLTGDPDAPQQVQVKNWRNRQWHYDMVDNPLRKPFPLKEYAMGGTVEYMTKAGPAGKNLHGKWIEVPPYKRVEMDKGTADWFIGRCYNSVPKIYDGKPLQKAIVSRKPSLFEPDMSWSLDDMNAYLQYIDPHATLEKPESDIQKRKLKKHEKEFQLEEAKRRTLRRLFFRLVDPSVRLPSRQEFMEFLNGSQEEANPDALDLVEKVNADLDAVATD